MGVEGPHAKLWNVASLKGAREPQEGSAEGQGEGASRSTCASEAPGCLSAVDPENQHCSPCAFPIRLLFVLLSLLWEAFPKPRLGQTPALGSHSTAPPSPARPSPSPVYPGGWGLGLHPGQTCESSVTTPELVHGLDLTHCHLPDLPFFLSPRPSLLYTVICIIF